jgi:hypothetical protein
MEINEKIKTGVVFEGAKVVPKWFIWENRRYDIKEINYEWTDRQGAESLFCFSVNTGANSYELSFNTKQMVWRLNKII